VQGFNRETRLFEVMVSPTWMNALDCKETIFSLKAENLREIPKREIPKRVGVFAELYTLH
jgi:hypothetical protein